MRWLNRYILLAVVMVCNVGVSQGQDQPHVYYFDKDLKFTAKDSAVFTGMGWNDGNHLKLRCFNVAAKTVVFLAHFTDTTLTVFDGLFQSFYANGEVQNEGHYVRGRMDGLWLRRDEFGNLTDSTLYKEGEELMVANTAYYSYQIPEKKVVKDFRKQQIYSTYYDVSGNVINSDTVDIKPGADSVYVLPELEANFPGGQTAWIQYVSNLAKKNRRALKKDNKEGACNVRFLVDKQGHVSDLKVLTMRGTALSRILMDAIINGPIWEPATQKGSAVKSIREMSITYIITPPDPLNDLF